MALFLLSTIIQQERWWCPMCGAHGGGWGMMWMWGFWLIVIAAIAGLAFALARRPDQDGGRGTGRRESPEETLRRRYASGEINRETYHRMLDDLGRRDG